ncbi:MAG: DUF3737 family protein [Oscillospiraceae bacterium]|nr:DUF3737 family protein [Oscillospiraceae bacterium]
MRNEIIAKQFDEERALYNIQNTDILDCVFAGPADGESALKEARDVKLENCSFSLRYPLWHVEKFHLHDSRMDELTRAPIWYSRQGFITDSDLCGIKAVRECEDITIRDCTITSEEFGWKSKNITVTDSTLAAQYLFLDSQNVTLDRIKMSGKYSFQYMENLTIRNSILDTKDAFWHSRNVTVENCLVKGEYLGWFSEGLTLKNCKIMGTQPLCYCKDLTLENCVMEDTDLAFEYSDVQATITGHVDSIKNPRSGEILLDSVGEIIMEDAVMECTGIVTVR